MIEQVIFGYLQGELEVPVFLERPDLRDRAFVFFEKTGSGRQDFLDSSTFAFQSYGKSLYEAASLNDQLKRAMDGMTKLEEISKVKLNSDYNYTDTELKEYRYQAVYDIWHY